MTVLLPALVGALLGAIFGSFLATLVIRWPESRAVIGGRSRCDHCGAPVSAGQMIPLLSYTLQNGRGRCCGKSIDPLHPTAEALAFMVGAVSFGLFGWNGFFTAMLGWLLLALALFDLRHFILPDWLNGSLLLAGLALPMSDGVPPILDRLIGVIAGYVSLALIAWLYRKARNRDGLGGGDSKLLAAVGAWVGWQSLPMIIVEAGLLGLGVAAVSNLTGFKVKADTRLPLGALIAAATWPTWMYLQTVA